MPGKEGIYSIYMSLRGSLARAVVGIVPPREIEDILQETYVRACQAENKRKISAPRSFLLKIARNLALDHAKRAETRLADSIEDCPDLDLSKPEVLADETFDRVATKEEFALFCDAVRHLPVYCRRAFILKKVYGCSQREIAREMNITENTVETHIAQGMKRCTYFMQQQEKQARRGGEVRRTDGNHSADASPRGRRP